MILQRDPRLRPEIQKYGCYMMSIFFLANKYIEYLFSIDIINDLYQVFVVHDWMGTDCYIYDPQKIVDFLGLPVQYTDQIESAKRVTQFDELELLKFQLRMPPPKDPWKHFVTGDGFGHIAYDPWGMSRAVRDGTLDSKRIFVWR